MNWPASAYTTIPRLTTSFMQGTPELPGGVMPQASLVPLAPSVNLSNAALSGQSSLMPDVWEQRISDLAQIGGKGGSQTGGLNPTAADSDLGFNLGTMNMGVKALAAIGGLYNSFQSNKLAKEQFAFTKEVTNTNLNNQIKTYNTTLEDRALARGRLNGEADPSAYAAAYTDKNKISRG